MNKKNLFTAILTIGISSTLLTACGTHSSTSSNPSTTSSSRKDSIDSSKNKNGSAKQSAKKIVNAINSNKSKFLMTYSKSYDGSYDLDIAENKKSKDIQPAPIPNTTLDAFSKKYNLSKTEREIIKEHLFNYPIGFVRNDAKRIKSMYATLQDAKIKKLSKESGYEVTAKLTIHQDTDGIPDDKTSTVFVDLSDKA